MNQPMPFHQSYLFLFAWLACGVSFKKNSQMDVSSVDLEMETEKNPVNFGKSVQRSDYREENIFLERYEPYIFHLIGL